MSFSSKAIAMALGLVAVLAAGTVAQNEPKAPKASQPSGDTLVIAGDASVDWIEKSDVAALKEGVIDKMELQVGDIVDQGKTIGYLHREDAELTVAKARVAANSKGPYQKALAQRELAIAILARSQRLRQRDIHAVAVEELEKNQAELKVAEAMMQEALENQKLAQAELDLATQALKEHTIIAPFDGVITERFKNPGESVRANEAVVRMGKIDKLRVSGWVPIQFAYQVKVGMAVDVTPNIANAVLPVEQKKFRGKITFVDPEVEPSTVAVRVFAEVENDPEHALRPGLKADMIIYLKDSAVPPVGQAPAVGARRSAPAR